MIRPDNHNKNITGKKNAVMKRWTKILKPSKKNYHIYSQKQNKTLKETFIFFQKPYQTFPHIFKRWNKKFLKDLIDFTHDCKKDFDCNQPITFQYIWKNSKRQSKGKSNVSEKAGNRENIRKHTLSALFHAVYWGYFFATDIKGPA